MTKEAVKTNGSGGDKAAPAVANKAKARPVLRLDQLQLREQVNNDWVVVAPPGVPAEALETPELWSAVAQRLQAYDFIRAIASDESWLAELVVRHAAVSGAVVKVLRIVELGSRISDEQVRSIPPNHRIYLGTPGEGWIVERTNPDGSITVMARGADQGRWSYEMALRWLLDHKSITQTVAGRA